MRSADSRSCCTSSPWSPTSEVLLEGLLLASLCVASVVLLVRRHWAGFCGCAFFLVLAPTSSVVPLAFALVGLLKFRMATYRWVSLLVWVYFAEGVVRATTEHGIVVALATLEVGLCLLLFAACVMHVRCRLQRGTVQS